MWGPAQCCAYVLHFFMPLQSAYFIPFCASNHAVYLKIRSLFEIFELTFGKMQGACDGGWQVRRTSASPDTCADFNTPWRPRVEPMLSASMQYHEWDMRLLIHHQSVAAHIFPQLLAWQRKSAT